MAKVNPLPVSRLHAIYDPARIPWPDSSHPALARLTKSGRNHFQPRAMSALDLALQINSPGYNVYLSGEADLGRTYTLLAYLRPRASGYDTPPDLVYVQNFPDTDHPSLIELPAGQGKNFRNTLGNTLERIRADLEARLETANFLNKRAILMEQFHSVRSNLLGGMKEMAAEQGFNVDLDETGGLMLSPMDSEDDATEGHAGGIREKLKEIRSRGNALAKSLLSSVRELNKAEKSFRDEERSLERAAMQRTLEAIFIPFAQKLTRICASPALQDYLDTLSEDILRNTDLFLPGHSQPRDELSTPADNIASRYAVNVFVDNSMTHGAPIIVEDNPTAANLLGCIERESEMGALVTDFTLIRSGSLHRANHGFLLLHAEDLLRRPQAWEGLMRALRASEVAVDDNADLPDSSIRTKGLRPQPLRLDLKVILIGTEDLYEELILHEERFAHLFRIKAHMAEEAERTSRNVRLYIAQIAKIAAEAGLLPFNPASLAWLVDLGSHICEDQKRLSLRFPVLRDLMVEASATARMRGQEIVNADVLEEAYANRAYRANLVEELFMEDYDRDMIKVATTGAGIGQVNGLSVTWQGDYEFGLPHRISCTVGVGHEGIIDLEREAELGGPIHTKAMMILKSFLTNLFARKKPLVLSASLYFEQSYAGIEGDSASGAELAALLSALAEVPVRLDLAFTGAVNHAGQIMAVGGVTRKIEGFYKVCSRRGLTGTQGVLIPADNVDHLMLSPQILQSVENRQFAIYPVRNMDEALLILTGLPVGRRRRNGTFTPHSLYDLVDRRLENLGAYAQNNFRRRKD